MSLSRPNTGDTIQATDVNQLSGVLEGDSGAAIPVALTALSDASNYNLTVKSLDTTNGKAFTVLKADGTVLLDVTKTGVKASISGSAAVTILTTTDTQSPTNKTFDTTSNATFKLLEIGLGADGTINPTSLGQAGRSWRITGLLRSAQAVTGEALWMQFNGDTGNHYSWQVIQNNAGVTAGEGYETSAIKIGQVPGTSAPTAGAAAIEITIPSYMDTNLHKSVLSHTFSRQTTGSGSMVSCVCEGSWYPATPVGITSILIFANGSPFKLLANSVLTIEMITQ